MAFIEPVTLTGRHVQLEPLAAGHHDALVAEQIPAEALRSKDEKIAVPPLAGALLKNEQDVHLFERLVFMARHNR